MWLLLLSSVGIPVMALCFFFLVEFAASNKELWEALQKASLDLCHVSIGIVGGLFLDEKLRLLMGPGAAVISVGIVMFTLILSAIALLLQKRYSASWGLEIVSYLSLFIGFLALAIPSGLIVWVGGH